MGGTARFAVKSGLNQRNRRFGLFLHYSQVFTRVEGGIGGPNPPAGALGSPVKSSPNLFSRKVKLQYSCLFFTITFAWLVRAVAHFNNFRNGAERLNNSNERKIRRFQPVGEAAETLRWFVKNWLKQWEMWCSVKTCLTTADRRNVFTWGERHSWRIYAALTGGFLSQIFK